MANVLIQSSTLTGIANAIRAKDGSTAQMYPSEMAGKIEAIETLGEFSLVASDNAVYSLPSAVSASSSEKTVYTFIPKYSGSININAVFYASRATTGYLYYYSGSTQETLYSGTPAKEVTIDVQKNVIAGTEYKIAIKGRDAKIVSLQIKTSVAVNKNPFN